MGGILAYLDRCGYDYVTGCVSVPVDDSDAAPGGQIRGVRDFVLRRHAAPAEYTVYPYRPVTIDGKGLDDIDPPARVAVPALMRGYLRLGAQVCGEPAHDPDFGVGDFPALLDKRKADTRYLKRLRSVAAASDMAEGWRRDRTTVPGCPGDVRRKLRGCRGSAQRQAGRGGRAGRRTSHSRASSLLSAVPLLADPAAGPLPLQRGCTAG